MNPQLSREAIALSILNGLIASCHCPTETGEPGALFLLGGELAATKRLQSCELAFQLADEFIALRDRA